MEASASAPVLPLQRKQLLADPVVAQMAMTKRVRSALRPPPAKGARRQLWKRDVKLWLQQHDRGADWELPAAEERQLVEWFNALDIDGSGSVEAEEIKALMNAVGVRCSPAMLQSMFASIQKQPHDELNMHDFVKLMHLNGGGIFRERDDDDGGSGGGGGGGGGAAGSDNSGLMMMAYRRQRMLTDIRDPSRRSGFSSKESFQRAYGTREKKKKHDGKKDGATGAAGAADDEGGGGAGGGGGGAVGDERRRAASPGASTAAAAPSSFATRMLASGGLSQKMLATQPPAAPASKWLAATTVQLNKHRTARHAHQQAAAAERGYSVRASTPELIEALEIRKDAVTGSARIGGTGAGGGLMAALEEGMAAQGLELGARQAASAAAPAARRASEAALPAIQTGQPTSHPTAAPATTAVPTLPPLAG